MGQYLGQPDSVVGAATRREPWQIALSAYTNNASFTALATQLQTVTAPAATSSLAVIYPGDANQIIIKPTGTDAANETFSFRLYAVRQYETGGTKYYIRDLLIEAACTNSATTVSTSINGNESNAFWCDTISVTSYAFNSVGVVSRSNSSDVPATLTVDTMGAGVLELEFAINSGTGAKANAFYTLV